MMVVSIFFSIIPIQPQYIPYNTYIEPPSLPAGWARPCLNLGGRPQFGRNNAQGLEILRYLATPSQVFSGYAATYPCSACVFDSLFLLSMPPPSPICRTCFANVHRTLPHSDCISMSIKILFGWECVFIEARWFSKRNLLIT